MSNRSTPIITEVGQGETRSRLSATTRPGAEGDIERILGERFSVRLQGAWTRAPLSIKSSSGQNITIDGGHVNATTLVLPLVMQINPHGAFRFHIMAGPAYAMYNVHRRTGTATSLPLFEGTRSRWGGAAGAGVAWWWSNRFAAQWQVEDIVTGSPFRITDVAPTATRGVHIPKVQNGHTTLGIRYRF